MNRTPLTTEENEQIDLFVEMCKKGNIVDVLSVYTSMGKKIRHFATNGYPFEIACFYGHLHIATWLHSINPSTYLDYNEAFCLACSGGHLVIVKWLYSLGCIDIYFETSRAFYKAKINKHLHILDYFVSLDNRFKPLRYS
jgi:hypothetical protein